MIAKPSIAFNDFSGTAKEVTARNVGGRNVLSVRAKQSKVISPSQALSRNKLSKVSRAYKQLSDSQMAAWAALAEHLKGISTFGLASEMTAHNAFVRINSNLTLVGKPMLQDAPEYVSDIPVASCEDLWVSPTFVCFTGINSSKDSHRLVVKMSGGQSAGVSSGWSKTVIVAAGVQDDWSEANITKLYASTIGYSPKLGEKVFIELWWMDTENGFTGESVKIAAICKTESQVEGEIYQPRNMFTIGDIREMPEDVTIEKFQFENAAGSALMISEVSFINRTMQSGFSGYHTGLPSRFMDGQVYVPSRGRGNRPWAIGLYRCYISKSQSWRGWQISGNAGAYDNNSELFGVTAFMNF